MDPNANLEEQLQLANCVNTGEYYHDDLHRLSELIIAMNDWLSSGGCLPDAWQENNRGKVAMSDQSARKLAMDIEKLRANLPKR